MIRLSRPEQWVLKGRRRWRVSNQAAAFAAIMLVVASAQIPAPDAAGKADAGFGNGFGTGTAEEHATEASLPSVPPLDRTEPEAPSSTLESSDTAGRSGKSRGLNLSLFLLRR